MRCANLWPLCLDLLSVTLELICRLAAIISEIVPKIKQIHTKVKIPAVKTPAISILNLSSRKQDKRQVKKDIMTTAQRELQVRRQWNVQLVLSKVFFHVSQRNDKENHKFCKYTHVFLVNHSMFNVYGQGRTFEISVIRLWHSADKLLKPVIISEV